MERGYNTTDALIQQHGSGSFTGSSVLAKELQQPLKEHKII